MDAGRATLGRLGPVPRRAEAGSRAPCPGRPARGLASPPRAGASPGATAAPLRGALPASWSGSPRPRVAAPGRGSRPPRPPFGWRGEELRRAGKGSSDGRARGRGPRERPRLPPPAGPRRLGRSRGGTTRPRHAPADPAGAGPASRPSARRWPLDNARPRRARARDCSRRWRPSRRRPARRAAHPPIARSAGRENDTDRGCGGTWTAPVPAPGRARWRRRTPPVVPPASAQRRGCHRAPPGTGDSDRGCRSRGRRSCAPPPATTAAGGAPARRRRGHRRSHPRSDDAFRPGRARRPRADRPA